MEQNIFSTFKKESPSSDNSSQPSPTENIFSEFKKPELSFKEKVQGAKQHLGRVGISELLATPKTIADLVKFGSHFLAQKGVEQQISEGKVPDPKSLKFTENILKFLGFPSEVLKKIGYPDAEQFEDMLIKFSEATGQKQVPKEPRNDLEKGARTAAPYISPSLIGSVEKLPQRLLTGTLSGISAAVAEKMGAGTGGQIGAAFAIPALLHTIANIKSGKFTPSTKELQELKKFGEGFGLSESELIPLLQTDFKRKALEKISKPTTAAAEVLESAETKLGHAFESVKADARKIPGASMQQTEKLVSIFAEIEGQLAESHMPGADKIAARDKIRQAMESIKKNGLTASNIIETWQDINRTVDWGAYRGGKKDLARLKAPFKEILRELDPTVAHNYEKINELWGRMAKMKESIGTNQLKKVIDYGEAFGFLGSIVSAPFTGKWEPIAAFIGVELSRRLATKMLTDPKYQNLYLKTAQAVKTGSKAVALKAFNELTTDLVEDFPEESQKVDWKKLQESLTK